MIIYSLDVSFSYLEPVCCSVSSSNCCFLTCIQVSQEAGQEVWYSHLFQNFPQFIVIHRVKGFGIVNKAEIDIFWNSLPFSMIQQMLSIWSLVPLTFLKPAWTSGYAKSLQSYPTLCNPIDGSPPGSPAPGILQARTLEWVAISFRKGVCQGCILSPYLFNLYPEYIMRNTGLEEAQAGIKIAGRNINNLRYADDTTLMAEVELKWRGTKKPLDESERGEWKSWLKAEHSENEDHGIWSHHFMGNRWGNSGWLYFSELQNHCRW